MKRDDVQLSFECDADWAQMPGSARVRHCGRCDTVVTNLSALTEAEARAFLNSRVGAPCVSYTVRRGHIRFQPPSAIQRLAASVLAATGLAGLSACSEPAGSKPPATAIQVAGRVIPGQVPEPIHLPASSPIDAGLTPAEAEALDELLAGGLGPRHVQRASTGSVSTDEPGQPTKLTRTQILTVVRANAARVRACALGDASGTIQVQLTITGSGAVTHATTVTRRFVKSPTAKCVEAEILTWRFPEFEGPPMRITMPFVL